MRSDASVKPAFWTGETGRRLRRDSDAQLVALDLITSPLSTLAALAQREIDPRDEGRAS